MSGLATAPSRGAPTYEEFYGLLQSPFSLAPDPRFLYLSESHEEAIRLLLQAVHRNERFIVLTGDTGTGKTTLSRALMGQVPMTTLTSLILNPFLSVEELLREVLLDFGIISHTDVRSGRVKEATVEQLMRVLHDFLASLVTLGGRAVLIIDEAQHLSPAVLDRIRVMSDIETSSSGLLQILLVGQPGLLDVLHQAEMRLLDQRVSLWARLKPLTRSEVEAYVAHRLSVAGASTVVRFEASAIDAVHALTNGVPRPINLLCDRALMIGAELSAGVITTEIVEESARTLDMNRRTLARGTTLTAERRFWMWIGVTVVALGGMLLSLFAF